MNLPAVEPNLLHQSPLYLTRLILIGNSNSINFTLYAKLTFKQLDIFYIKDLYKTGKHPGMGNCK